MFGNRPLSLVAAAAVVAIEGLTALVLGGYVAVETFVGDPEDLAGSLFVAGFGLLVGAGLLYVAWGLLQAQRWARSPGVVAQLFLLPVVYTAFSDGNYLLGVPAAVAALAGLVSLLAQPTAQALYGPDGGRQ